MDKERHEQALANIDKGIEEAQAITVEDAIELGIAKGIYDIKEAELIREHFKKVFHKDE